MFFIGPKLLRFTKFSRPIIRVYCPHWICINVSSVDREKIVSYIVELYRRIIDNCQKKKDILIRMEIKFYSSGNGKWNC